MAELLSMQDIDNMTPQQVADYQAQVALEQEARNEDGTLKEGYIEQDGKIVKGTAQQQQQSSQLEEGRNADGTLQEGYEEKDGKVVKVETKPAGDKGEPDTAAEFWDSVLKMANITTPFKFDNVEDALSPEAVAVAITQTREDAVASFEAYLQKKDPRGFAYFVHRENGGSDDAFFAEARNVIPDRAEFEDSADMQAAYIKNDLVAKGVPEDIAKSTVDAYIKANTIKDKALALYNRDVAIDEKRLEDLKKENSRLIEEETKTINKFGTQMEASLATTGILIPEPQKVEFLKFARSNMQYDKDNKVFVRVQEVNPEELGKVMASLYFDYVKGDLKQLIARGVQTKAVQQLRLNAQQANDKNKGSKEATNQNKGFVSLQDI